MGHFSYEALRQRVKDIEAKYANGGQADDGDDTEDHQQLDGAFDNDDHVAGDFDGGDGGQQGGSDENHQPANADNKPPVEEDPFEAKWKSRINSLAGKMRAEFGVTSDAELDDSLTPEQRYKLIQADYNAAVMERRRGGGTEEVKPPVDQASNAAQQQPATDEVEEELAALFGDEAIAKTLAKVVRKVAGTEVGERVKPVEKTLQQTAEAEFTNKVWSGPLAGVDHKSEQWVEFNSKPVPFSGGKTMGDVLREAHNSRDIKTFEAVRAEFDNFTGKASGQQSGQQVSIGQASSRPSGFASIATGGRRSAASVTSDNSNAGIANIREALNQAERGAQRGDVPWSKVRELRSQLSAAYVGR